MEVIRTIKPGQPGTRRFQQHWGDNLVAVRYRRDRNRLYTTIEIIVDERERPDRGVSLNAVHSRERQQLVAVRIAFEEHALRVAVKRSHARWSVEHKVWIMPYNIAVALGIKDRVVEGLAERCSDVGLCDGEVSICSTGYRTVMAIFAYTWPRSARMARLDYDTYSTVGGHSPT